MNEYLPISCASGSLKNLALQEKFLALLEDIPQHKIKTLDSSLPDNIQQGDIIWVEEGAQLLTWDGKKVVPLALKIPVL